MSLITSSIPNMVNGVSQQPFALRSATQAEEQINGLSSISKGLRKRPAFRHIAKIMDGKIGNAFVHLINRDQSERYVVEAHNGGLQVFDLEGYQLTVNMPNGASYLQTVNPQEDIDAVTVADYTFIVNKNIVVEKATTTAPSRQNENMVWVKQGSYGAKYTIKYGTAAHSYTTPDGSEASHSTDIATDKIATQLANGIRAAVEGTGGSVSTLGSVVFIKNGGTHTVAAEDSLGNTAAIPIGPEVQRFSDLPAQAPIGFEVEVAGDQSSSFDNYYVKFTDGVWKETIKQGEKTRLWGGSMPHALIREADGTFTFREIQWEPRNIGDLKSNPFPSFVGQSLNGVFFHRNRLGFIAGENLVMSKAGDFFNFFKGTATDVLDDDPVDVGVSHTKVSILRHAVPFAETLLLFSDQTQFQLGRAEILTPNTISINQTTEYETSLQAKPGAAGRFVYFTVGRGEYSGVREYFVDRNTEVSEAADVTGHVPAYIPGDVFKIASTSNEDALVLASNQSPNELFIYRFYWADSEKMQASWSRWNLGDQARILNCDFIESDLYAVIEREDGVYLEVCSLAPGYRTPGLDFAIHMDRLSTQNQVFNLIYDGTNTTFELAYKTASIDQLQVVTGQAGSLPGGIILKAQVDNSGIWTKVTVPNRDLRNEAFAVGITYEFRYRLSQLALREPSPGGGQKTVTSGRTQIRKVKALYAASGYFRAEVTPFRRPTYEYVWAGRKVGSARNPIGSTAIDGGEFDFPVLARNDNVSIEFVSDSFLPVSLLGAEWECYFTTRSKRM